ncbi:hypothetical protein ACIQLG_00755 [Terribacillus saccharophilus]|uniref:hypothetical protein n=1 Tax=Terribacillus saccharophilus TaxID=361277 RepID=UPI00380324BD
MSIRQGINGEQMAKELHLDPTTVSKMKNDKPNVTTDTAHYSLRRNGVLQLFVLW